jgi:hypothetical protein
VFHKFGEVEGDVAGLLEELVVSQELSWSVELVKKGATQNTV